MADGLRLLSSVLANGAVGVLTEVDADMFQNNEPQAFEFIRDHFRRHRELPTASTVQEETGIRLPSAPEAVSFYLDAFNSRHDYNIFRTHYATLREAAGHGGQAVPQIKETVARLHRALNRTGQRREIQQINEAAESVLRRMALTRGYGGITGIETGWPTFDGITGGFQDTDLITIVGRMGLGKTYVLLKMAEYAHSQGENVLFVTTEMGTEQIARRHLSIALGINPFFLKTNQISSYTERRIRNYYRDMVGGERFRVFSVGMKSKVDAVEAFMQEFGPTIVFIDGGYLLRPTEGPKNMNRIERITEVWNELLGLKNAADTPIVVTSQFNRSAGKGGKEGSLETVAFSDAIGMNSAIVAALKDGPTENPKASREFDFLKGREGEEGKVAINFKFAPLDMSELTPEQVESETGQPAADVTWMQ